jgi:hypothetical protein
MIDVFDYQKRFPRCLNCGRDLKWHLCEVEGTAGERLLSEDSVYADCKCGFGCEMKEYVGGK